MSAPLDVVPAAPKRPSGLNARLVTHAVRRRPFWFAGVILLAAGMGAAIWLFLPLSKSAAAVTFQVHQPQALLGAAAGANDQQAFKAIQIGRLRARPVLSQALNEPGVAQLPTVKAQSDPVAWLEKGLKVEAKGLGPDMFRAILEGESVADLQTVLGALAKVYLADVDLAAHGKQRDRHAKLKKTVEGLEKEIEQTTKRISDLAATVGGTRGEQEVLDMMRAPKVSQVGRDLTAAQTKLELAKAEVAQAQARLALFLPVELSAGQHGPPAPPVAPPLSEVQIDALVRANPFLAQADQVVEGLQSAVARLEGVSDPEADPLLKAKAKLAAARENRDLLRAAARRGAVNRLVDKERATAHDAVEQAMRVVRLEEVKVGLVQKEVDKLNTDLKAIREMRAELQQHQNQIETKRNIRNEAANKLHHLEVELDNITSRVTRIDEPFPVAGLEGNKRLKYTLMAVVGVFVVGFAGLVGWEAKSRRVTHTDDATTDLGVRLLGTVPPLGLDGQPGAPPAALAEAIDTARTMLLHGSPAGAAIRTVLVTSGVAGEGKTSLAGHLSISLARAGFRTILVDGDLQSPSAHRLFDCPVGPGLCELLRDEIDVEDAARPTPVPGLTILPAGRWDTAARQALVGDRWRRLKADLEGRYDFVVVDTAPLLLVSDTLLLAREADGVVLSVLLGVSQVSHVAESAGRLQAVGARLTGAVVNGVWHQAYRAGAAYRYANASPPPAGALADGQS